MFDSFRVWKGNSLQESSTVPADDIPKARQTVEPILSDDKPKVSEYAKWALEQDKQSASSETRAQDQGSAETSDSSSANSKAGAALSRNPHNGRSSHELELEVLNKALSEAEQNHRKAR